MQDRDNLNASSSVPKASEQEQDSAVKIEDTKATPENVQIASEEVSK